MQKFAAGKFNSIVLVITFLFIALFTEAVFADTHYVWKNGANSAPYTTWTTASTTIAAGIGAASAGDTVVVRASVDAFVELDLFMKPGVDLVAERSSIKPIIKAQHGTDPVITYASTDDFTGSNAASIDGFELTPPGNKGVYITGAIDTGSVIRNCYIHDFAVSSTVAAVCIMPGTNSCAVIIEYNVISGARTGVYVENAIGQGTSRVVVRYNTIRDSSQTGGGINIAKGSRVTIGPDNVLEDNYKCGIIVGQQGANDNVIIRNNKILRTNAPTGWGGSGIEVESGSADETLTIEDNVIQSSSRAGVHVNGYAGHIILTGNTIYNNGRPGIAIPIRGSDSQPEEQGATQIYPTVTIRQNRIFNNGSIDARSYGAGIYMPRGYGVIENNLIYDNHGAGIRTRWLATETPEPGLSEISHVTSIMNNTLVNNGKFNPPVPEDPTLRYPIGAGISNGDPFLSQNVPPPPSTFTSPGPIIIKNNVITKSWRAAIRYCFNNTPGAEERDYNLLYDSQRSHLINGTEYEYEKYQPDLRADCHRGPDPGSGLQLSCVEHAYASCGTHAQNGALVLDDPHVLFADPQFVDEDNGDYRLKSTSLGHNAGSDGTDVGCYGGNYPMTYVSDRTPPTFGGLVSATNVGTEGAVDLAWNVASDPSTPITYNIYYWAASGQQNFASPKAATQSAAYRVTGLASGTTYYFVVRAMDAQENEDGNENELSATPTDTVAPTFGGLVSAADAQTGGAVNLSWSAASDGSPPITYNIYYATTSGGQNFSTPNATNLETTHQITGLTNGTPYYFVVRANDSYGNEDSNTVERSATPHDTTPDVCPSGCDYTSIQTAINNGLTDITVGDGSYSEHLTISSAIIVRSSNGASSTTIDGGGSGGRVVTFNLGSGVSPTFSGFTIQNGSNPSDSIGGAGIGIINGSPEISNCIITSNSISNKQGAGIYIAAGAAKITNCTISSNNSGGQNGGGVYIADGTPEISGCTISNNTSTTNQGGGMYINGGTPTITSCTFSNNKAAPHGNGIYINNVSPTITFCTFTGNQPYSGTGYGGAVLATGASAAPIIRDSTFTGNSNYRGGGISTLGTLISSIEITRCNFESNSAGGEGGALYLNASTAAIESCSIESNTSSMRAGGVFLKGTTLSMLNSYIVNNSGTSNYEGGGIYVASGSGSVGITNCTLSNNSAGGGASSKGGAIYNGGSTTTIKNCILWNDSSGSTQNGQDEIYHSSGSTTVSYTDIEGSYTGTGNINSNPSFVNSGTGDYHLQAGSVCIDAGTSSGAPSNDFDGDSRPQASGYDMGADESI